MAVAAPEFKIVVRSVTDRVLQDNITRMSQASGRTVKEETRTVFKGMVRDAIIYTPPAGGQATGKNAQRQGEAAISRDLRLMGFVPVDIKGFRMQTQAFGKPITPVRVPMKENPKFAEPDAFHIERLRAKSGRRPSRGRSQAFYVAKAKFSSMASRLKKEVGELAAGWIRAAHQLGVPVPAWIAKHGDNGRGTAVEIAETEHRITMRVVNHFPGTATNEADEMIRRIARLKDYAIARLKRQLPYLLRKRLREAKRN